MPAAANSVSDILITGRAAVSERLSVLYLRRDECWLTGEDQAAYIRQIEAIEGLHRHLLSPCHLCEAHTAFRDDAYDLPFCWRCLHERYDHWYRHLCYRRSGQCK